MVLFLVVCYELYNTESKQLVAASAMDMTTPPLCAIKYSEHCNGFRILSASSIHFNRRMLVQSRNVFVQNVSFI